jgi:hypothetical protein
VPSADEAVARTRELMSALGLDPDQFAIEPYADEWYASVAASEQLDGAFAGRRVDTGFGAAGVLQYAGGQLAEPVRVGPYPLIDLEAALARLNDPSGFYAGGGMVALDAAVARQSADSPVAVDVVDVPPATAVAAVEPTTSESAPLEPEQVTVTLVDVQADVWWAWDVDGSVWLLPAYRFIGDDGGWYTVPAVTDEFLVQVPVDSVPVTEPAPMPVEPAPPETMPVESVPVDSVPVESVPVGTVVDVEPLQGSVGKTLAEFTADAEALGLSVRIVEQDGVALAVTMDFSPTRVNVAVTGEGESGLVTAIVNTG